jgi:AAA ATPase domain
MSVLAGLVAAVRAGESRVLVVRGEPGVGKTALLDYLAGQAQGCRVVRAAGVQSEIEFAFAGLHQLLAPMLDRVERLPVPQRDALRTVFGLSAGPAPDRFLVALAVLGLLSEVAGERPLVCVIDDQQWLDGASAQALGFAARRLAAEPVGLVFGVRVPGTELAGLPELAVEGLADGDARALLDSALTGPLDARVRDQIIAEADGNPLALLELPHAMTSAELAGGFGLPGAGSLTGRIEDSFRRRLDALPAQTRRLLLLAAAEPREDEQAQYGVGQLAARDVHEGQHESEHDQRQQRPEADPGDRGQVAARRVTGRAEARDEQRRRPARVPQGPRVHAGVHGDRRRHSHADQQPEHGQQGDGQLGRLPGREPHPDQHGERGDEGHDACAAGQAPAQPGTQCEQAGRGRHVPHRLCEQGVHLAAGRRPIWG